MQITLSWDNSVGQAPAGFQNAVQTAANILAAQITDNIAVTIHVGWGETGGTAIPSGALATGAPDTSYTFNSYSDLAAALGKQGNGLGTNLPATDPTGGSGSWSVSMAEAEALGLSGATAASGSIGFSSDPSVSWNFNTSQGIGNSQYDFVSTALHEITHALGRINFPYGSGSYDALNLYTYAAPGVLQLSQASPAYFSVNGGTTNLNNFDMSSTGDPADWATTLTDSFGPGPTGIAGPMSATDWLVMESLGFHVKPTYILFGPTDVNAGAHDYLQLSTVNVAAGTSVKYAISGLTASQLDSGSLSGTATVGSDGTALIDLGVQAGASSGSATVTLSDSSANTLASYAVTVNGTANNALVAVPGAGVATTAYGTNNNDTITGPVNGVVNYDGAFTDYIITQPAANTLQVYDPMPGRDGTDTLVGVDRLSFTDTSVAFDLGATQSAGHTAEILGAALGKSALSNAVFVGIGIKLFDAGQTLQNVAQLVMNDNLISSNPSTFVSTVWSNVVGSPIDAQSLTNFTQMITGAASAADEEAQLLAMAAALPLNQAHIGLSGLAQHGIDYTPA